MRVKPGDVFELPHGKLMVALKPCKFNAHFWYMLVLYDPFGGEEGRVSKWAIND